MKKKTNNIKKENDKTTTTKNPLEARIQRFRILFLGPVSTNLYFLFDLNKLI